MIIDLINKVSSSRTNVTAFGVANFSFDCQLEESHVSILAVSDNAMESGALMADHSYLNPKEFSVRGLMVSYIPYNNTSQPLTSGLDAAKQLPILSGIVGKTEQGVAKVNRYAGTVLRMADKVKDVSQVLAPWLPSSLSSLGDNTDKVASRMSQAYDDLLTIQRNGELLSVTSNLKTYDNMLLTGVSVTKGENDAAEFNLVFREVFVVETRTIQGLVVNVPVAQKSSTTASKVDGKAKSGRSASQAAQPKSKGKTQPVKQTGNEKRSMLRSGVLLFKGDK